MKEAPLIVQPLDRAEIQRMLDKDNRIVFRVEMTLKEAMQGFHGATILTEMMLFGDGGAGTLASVNYELIGLDDFGQNDGGDSTDVRMMIVEVTAVVKWFAN